jgi:hypothetical protein
MEPTDIIITNVLPTGSSFAVMVDDMTQNIFIPSKSTAQRPVRPGERLQAIVVPNMTHGHKTRWLAVSILDAAPLPQDDALAEMILDTIAFDGRGTVEEIATALNMSDAVISAKLSELAASGQLVRLTCFDFPEEDE